MKPRSVKALLLITAVFLVFILGNYGFISLHEQAHREVFRVYGCNSTTDVWLGYNGIQVRTTATDCALTPEIIRTLAENEIVGNNALGIVYNMWTLGFALMFVMFCFRLRLY
jgi:hypothetical protein